MGETTRQRSSASDFIDANFDACYKIGAVVERQMSRLQQPGSENGFIGGTRAQYQISFQFRRKPDFLSNEGILDMNKAELIDAVADKSGMSKTDAGRAVDTVIDAITKALKKGDKVSLVGFGVFSVRKRAARKGRNPKTGAEMKIPAGKTPAFKAGKGLKDAVN